MSTDKTKVISCRIDAEAAERLAKNLENKGITLRFMLENYGVNTKNEGVNTKISKNGVNTYGKSVNTMAEKSKNVVNNSVYTTSESVNTQIMIPEAIYKDFLAMAKCFGMKYEDLMSDVDYLMNEGYLFIDGKRLQSMDSRLNTEAFFKKCEELGYAGKEQAILDKLVKGMMVKK